MATFNLAQSNVLRYAAERLELTSGSEPPLDEETIKFLAPLAADKGFLGEGLFVERIHQRPHSTLLRFLLHMAGT
jgi:hypothetical protein